MTIQMAIYICSEEQQQERNKAGKHVCPMQNCSSGNACHLQEFHPDVVIISALRGSGKSMELTRSLGTRGICFLTTDRPPPRWWVGASESLSAASLSWVSRAAGEKSRPLQPCQDRVGYF